MKELILLGGGGHCKSVIDSIKSTNKYKIIGILDLKDKIGEFINGVQVIGEDRDLLYYYEQGIKNAFITTGGIGDNSLRIRLFENAKSMGFQFPVITDAKAIVSDTAIIAEGVFIGKGTIINTNVSIKENSIINTGAIIEHDCQIDAHCHIAPGSTLSGAVHIGKDSHIGTNSTVIQNINVGSNTIIGAGSVVVKNIGDHKKAYGNPCRVV